MAVARRITQWRMLEGRQHSLSLTAVLSIRGVSIPRSLSSTVAQKVTAFKDSRSMHARARGRWHAGDRAETGALVRGIVWPVYRTWGILPALLGRILSRDPLTHLRWRARMFLRLPFNPPSDRFEPQ